MVRIAPASVTLLYVASWLRFPTRLNLSDCPG